MPTCPECGSTDTESLDCYDYECNECGTVFTAEGGSLNNDEDYGRDR